MDFILFSSNTLKIQNRPKIELSTQCVYVFSFVYWHMSTLIRPIWQAKTHRHCNRMQTRILHSEFKMHFQQIDAHSLPQFETWKSGIDDFCKTTSDLPNFLRTNVFLFCIAWRITNKWNLLSSSFSIGNEPQIETNVRNLTSQSP